MREMKDRGRRERGKANGIGKEKNRKIPENRE